jgi:hypothetical protein
MALPTRSQQLGVVILIGLLALYALWRVLPPI